MPELFPEAAYHCIYLSQTVLVPPDVKVNIRP